MNRATQHAWWLALLSAGCFPVECDPGGGGGSGGAAGTAGAEDAGGAAASGGPSGGSGGAAGQVDAGADVGASGSAGGSGASGSSAGGAGGMGGAAQGGQAGSGGSGGQAGGPVSLVCGDGVRDVEDEECDDGNANDSGDSCTNACTVLDVLAVPGTVPDGGVRPPGRHLREGRHPVAAGADGFAVAFVQPDSVEPVVALTSFDANGVPTGTVTALSNGTTPVLFASPVLAALPNGSYAAAWTDFASGFSGGPSGDGDELGIALRGFEPATGTLGATTHANQHGAGQPDRTAFSQRDPDILSVGNDVVVAWVDDANVASAPDVRFRIFDQSLTPRGPVQDLADTVAAEGSIALAPFKGGWAAAWRSSSAGNEVIQVVAYSNVAPPAATESWTVGPFLPAPADERPALAEMSDGTLLLVFTEGTDPGMTGVANTPRLRGAILRPSATGSTPWFDIDALDPDYFGLWEVAQSHANAIAVNGRVYISWRTDRLLGDSMGEELWLKEILCNPAGQACTDPAPDLGMMEIPLPRQTLHREGDQRFPALASSPLGPEGAVVAAWDDFGRVFGAIEGAPDVVVELIPSPIVRLPGGELLP